MKLRVVISTGPRLEFDGVEGTLTVDEVKQLVASSVDDFEEDEQRAIYRGRVLENDQTLDDLRFEDGDTVHVTRARRAPTDNSVPVVPSPASPTAGQAALGGMDPDMMRAIMDNPLFQGMMNDPETLRSLLLANPQMRDLVDQNPEIGHILSDPNMLRQTVETARNPELMREAMRNTDRAMSNIEAHPEGFNALRRMYNSIQEPLNQIAGPGDDRTPPAATGGRSAPNGAEAQNGGGQPRDTPNTAALPNPWAGPQARPGPLPTNLGPGPGSSPSALPRTLAGAGQTSALEQMLSAMPAVQHGGFPGAEAHADGADHPRPAHVEADQARALSQEAMQAAEARYAQELDVIKGMGFDDRSAALEALVATGGNINAAVSRLLGGM